MAELADALGSGPSELTMLVQVQVLSSALRIDKGNGSEASRFFMRIPRPVLVLPSARYS